jgi:hypothetical protein
MFGEFLTRSQCPGQTLLGIDHGTEVLGVLDVFLPGNASALVLSEVRQEDVWRRYGFDQAANN